MISSELIFLNCDVTNTKDAIEFLVTELEKKGVINDKSIFSKSVWNREKMVSTSVGYGVAIPHGKDDSVEGSFVAFLRPKKEFIWDPTTEDYVNAIFMIGVPETGGERTHLKIISKLSKNLLHDTFRNSIQNAANSEEVYEILKQIEN